MNVTITGVPGFDGTYPLDLKEQPFTMGELHLIKQVSGVRAGQLAEASDAGDSDVMVALSVIAMRRAGKVTKERALELVDVLMDAAGGSIRYSEDDAGPPEQPPSERSEGESTAPSSPDSNGAGDELQVTDILTPTGRPA